MGKKECGCAGRDCQCGARDFYDGLLQLERRDAINSLQKLIEHAQRWDDENQPPGARFYQVSVELCGADMRQEHEQWFKDTPWYIGIVPYVIGHVLDLVETKMAQIGFVPDDWRAGEVRFSATEDDSYRVRFRVEVTSPLVSDEEVQKRLTGHGK